MKQKPLIFSFFLLFLFLFPKMGKAGVTDEKPLRVGYALAITKVNSESMRYAKDAGISSIEISLGELVNKERQFQFSDEEVIDLMIQVKKATSEAGIEIWSIHMPFGEKIDLSLVDEQQRQQVIQLHEKLLGYLAIIQPKVILFHPSWYLGLNEREARKVQLIKSVTKLNDTVIKIGAIMVIENMLGPELLVNETMERPLNRTVEETVEIMNRLPASIYAAVDMNHIKDPQNLIRALGSRIRSIHVADGDGEHERHYMPCSGKGENNWNEILSALDDVNYSGPFMFECAYDDVKDLTECYEMLYLAYENEEDS